MAWEPEARVQGRLIAADRRANTAEAEVTRLTGVLAVMADRVCHRVANGRRQGCMTGEVQCERCEARTALAGRPGA